MAVNPALRLVKKLGSNGKVGKKFGVTREAVRQWTIKGIPTDRALEVEEVTRGDISAEEILRFARKRECEAA